MRKNLIQSVLGHLVFATLLLWSTLPRYHRVLPMTPPSEVSVVFIGGTSGTDGGKTEAAKPQTNSGIALSRLAPRIIEDSQVKAEPTAQGTNPGAKLLRYGDPVLEALRQYFESRVSYPASLIRENHQGQVVARISIDINGEMTAFEILRADDRYLRMLILKILRKARGDHLSAPVLRSRNIDLAFEFKITPTPSQWILEAQPRLRELPVRILRVARDPGMPAPLDPRDSPKGAWTEYVELKQIEHQGYSEQAIVVNPLALIQALTGQKDKTLPEILQADPEF